MQALHNILLFTDNAGIEPLLKYVPREKICALVGAQARPQYHELLRARAAAYGIPFFIQPSAKEAEAYRQFMAALRSVQPDGILCFSYAMLIHADLRALVDGRAFNVHASLLPRHRGPNPIQWALIHDDAQTGATLHKMDEGFDSGPILDQEAIPVGNEDTWLSLKDKVDRATDRLLARSIPQILVGDWHEAPQNESLALQNARISPESFAIDFATMPDRTIYNLIRAQVAPLAGVYTETAQGRIRFPQFVALNDIALLRQRVQKGN